MRLPCIYVTCSFLKTRRQPKGCDKLGLLSRMSFCVRYKFV